MCVKWWLRKFDITNLKSVTCLGFFNIEKFYQSILRMKLLGRVDNVYYLELDKQIIHYNKYYLKGRSLVMNFLTQDANSG